MKLTRLHTGPRYHHYQRRVIKVKWIRPQDGLPELKNHDEFGNSCSYDVLIYDGAYHIAYLYADDDPEDIFWIVWPAAKEIGVEDIICWAPIPEPPKEWMKE